MIISSTYLINYSPVDDIRNLQEDIKQTMGSDFTYMVGSVDEGQQIPNDVYIFLAQQEDDKQVRRVQWSNTQAYLTVQYKSDMVNEDDTNATWDWYFSIFKFMQKLLRKTNASLNSSMAQFMDQRAVSQKEGEPEAKATNFIKQQFPVPTVDNSYTDVSHAFHYTIKKQFQVGIEITNVRDLYGDKGISMTVAVDDTMLAQVYDSYESMADTSGIVLGMLKSMANGGLVNFVDGGRLPDDVYEITAHL